MHRTSPTDGRVVTLTLVLLALPLGAGAQTVQNRAAAASAAPLSSVSADGTTPLHRAVVANDVSAVQRLLRSGVSPELRTRYGVTPLSLAASYGYAPIVTALLAAGAGANGTSKEGEPVLMTAARSGNVDIVKTLLAHGADVDAREQWLGQTALMWAAAENHAAVVSALLEAGAQPTVATTRLDYWEMQPIEQATPKVNTPKGGMVALHYAARQGALDAVRALDGSALTDLDQADPDGVTPLLYATLNGHYDVAALLLHLGADVTRADRYGRTVLYAAVDMRTLEVEPRPSPRTEEAVSALALAQMAIDFGADLNAPLKGRAPSRCSNGCYVLGGDGATPLWRAARENDVAAFKLLLDAGADPHVRARDGSTPLMVAAGHSWRDDHSLGSEAESIEIITMLLKAGSDLSDRDRAGETALHYAAARGADTVVSFLVEQGARLDAKDPINRTPLDAAMGIAQTVRVGGGAPVDAPVRVSTAKLLTSLMAARGIAIEPYAAPPPAPGPKP